jgi:thioredoxin reductase (NADPH)
MHETGDELTTKAAPTPPVDPLLAPRLTEGQLALLRRYGEARATVAGQVLFREGDRGYDFIVILSGAVTVVDHQAGVMRELATGGPGEFVAELNTAFPTSGSTSRPIPRRVRCSATMESVLTKPPSWSCGAVRSYATRQPPNWRGPRGSARARSRARPSTWS